MSPFKNITLVGKGSLGSAVLVALVDAGFTVQLLSRSNTVSNVPSTIKVVQVDYTSLADLTTSLRGQDVLISTVGAAGIPGQKVLIDAAIQAGVKRFIPSDFGSLTTDPAAQHLPPHITMVEIQNYLKAKADAGLIEYTILSIGAFTEFLVHGSKANTNVQLWAGGNQKFSSTSLSGIGKVIVGTLNNPEGTKNRNIRVHEIAVTQALLLRLAKKYAPPETEWNITDIVDVEAEYKEGEEAAASEPTIPNMIRLLTGMLMSGKYQAFYEPTDNDLVGLKLRSEEDLDAMFKQAYGDGNVATA
ncbi:hypothetical protein FB567DRAFT_565254 [Paraphoma chrysanthemicola]|uniref:NAD(P)-binding domain-containing protein n=1 Tax=Paraphoma chrysanthemicola TaxID=798071 RepID=A0A8K0QT10_9PLEO|nr:hypothetical protein FB567DRAFT_565254 [Paraphoma chrysanthemicola]